MLDQKAIIKQIDEVLGKYNPAALEMSAVAGTLGMMLSAIRRLAPTGSVYANSVERYEPSLSASYLQICMALEQVVGMLRALKHDYEFGYLQSVVEEVHADVFADFLDMARYLLKEGMKDPAAVVIGSVLESHLRKLCDKLRMSVLKTDGTPKKADTLNSELKAAGAYNLNDQKGITAWLGLRNDAAHGKYTEYKKEQVELMLDNVRNFISRIPA